MNVEIPQALRNADITRFATRAAQLEKIEPVISYWCYYWIVNKILSKQLHLADDETRAYTADLMDRLEKYRLELKDHETVTDDVVAQAYVEQFGGQTFQRADNAMVIKRATQQTADTFRAAATFFDLLGIWGPLSHDIVSKARYAKHHALRIQKAFRAGEDPNTYDLPQSQEQAQQSNDLSDTRDEKEVIVSPETKSAETTAALHHDLDEESRKSPSAQLPSAQINLPNLQESSEPAMGSNQDILSGSNYSRPTVEEEHQQSQTYTSEPVRYNMPRSSLEQGGPEFGRAASSGSVAEMPGMQSSYQAPSSNIQRREDSSQATLEVFPQNPCYRTDDNAISDAQKHAKWAVSALNFEDVDTAVKELRIALDALGAT